MIHLFIIIINLLIDYFFLVSIAIILYVFFTFNEIENIIYDKKWALNKGWYIYVNCNKKNPKINVEEKNFYCSPFEILKRHIPWGNVNFMSVKYNVWSNSKVNDKALFSAFKRKIF